MAAPMLEPEKPNVQGDAEVVRTLGLDAESKRKPWVRAVLTLLVFVAIAALIVMWMQARKRARAPVFQTAAITRGDLNVTVTATGTIQGLNTVEVGAEVSGRVAKVLVDFNDRVEEGQLLAEIDPEQFRAAVEEAKARVVASEANIRQARATLAETKAQAERARSQIEKGLISQRDLEVAESAAIRAEASLSSAQADATLARAALKSAEFRLERTKIIAPIAGIVLSRLIEPGQTVTAGFQTPILFKLTENLSRMSLHVYVDEADVGRVKEGQEATFTVDAYPGRDFASKVLSLRNEPRTEQNVVSYEAVLAVDNSELLLRPGMTATASIMADTRKDVLLAPNAALRFVPPQQLGPPGPPGASPADSNAGKRLWVLREGRPAALEVEIGATDGLVTEVSGEIEEGTEVLTDIVEKP